MYACVHAHVDEIQVLNLGASPSIKKVEGQ